MQKLVQKKLVQEKYSSTGSRLWRFRIPLAAVVVVPAAVGFGNVIAGSLAAKAKPPAAALGYLTTLREPVLEKDSSSDSRLRWVGVSLAAASVVLAVSAARALRSIIDGSLAVKEKLQAVTTGDGTTPMQADTTGDGTAPMQADTTGDGTTPQTPTQEKDSSSGSRLWWIVGIPVAAGLVTAVVAVVVVPVVVGAFGFGAGGITAGSLGAKGMSLAAITGYVAITWGMLSTSNYLNI